MTKKFHPRNRQERILMAKKKANKKGMPDGVRSPVVEESEDHVEVPSD